MHRMERDNADWDVLMVHHEPPPPSYVKELLVGKKYGSVFQGDPWVRTTVSNSSIRRDGDDDINIVIAFPPLTGAMRARVIDEDGG